MTKVIQISHREATAEFLSATLRHLNALIPNRPKHTLQTQIIGILAAEVLDHGLRSKSKWLPTHPTASGTLSLLRLIPDMAAVIENGLYDEYYGEIYEPYQHQLEDILDVAGLDLEWAEYSITGYSSTTVTIEIIGDRRILEWERQNETRKLHRAAYAKTKQTVCYPVGYVRNRI